MGNYIINQLEPTLECNGYTIHHRQIFFRIASTKSSATCPYCGYESDKVHSVYQREIQDIPIQEKQTIFLLDARKMFCLNSDCNHKTFSERFDFVSPKGKPPQD